MGASLMSSAYHAAAETGLGHAATRLLVYMAFRALDSDARPVSYIGRDLAAEVLGYRGTEAQRYGALKKVVAELKRHGLIALRNQPHEGRRAEYVLSIPQRVPDSSPLFRSEGGNSLPRGGNSHPQEGGSHGTPKEEGKTNKEGSSPHCSKHPNGTDKPCWACKEAREKHEATTRKPKGPSVEERCRNGQHKWLPDGTCNFCTKKRIAPDEWMQPK